MALSITERQSDTVSRQTTWGKVILTIILFSIVFVLAFSMRAFRHDVSFDVFIDEITYLRLSESVVDHGWANLYEKPFHLHPPAFFYLQAVYLSIVDPIGDVFTKIYSVRYVNLILSSLTAVALFGIANNIRGKTWAFFVALLFCIDPFIIRMNSRNLLDTAVLFWVTLGYWAIISGIVDENNKLSLWRIILSGICFGLSILTKDMGVFLTILPLGGMFVLGWYLPRLTTFLIGSFMSLTYSIYVIATIAVGEWAFFYDEKLSGLTRLIGFHKETGLNREGGPSLIEKIFERLVEFGPTYTLIGLGGIAMLILLVWGKRSERIIAAWGAGAYALLAYTILFGTLEEQFFYFLIVPCVLLITLAIPVLQTLFRHTGLYNWLQGLVVLFVVVFIASSAQEWFVRHFSPDNGYENLYNYIQTNIRPTGQIASTSEASQFLLTGYTSGPWGSWYTVEELAAYRPQYLVVSYEQVEWDYGERADELLAWVEENGELIYDFNSRTNQLALFALDFND